MRGTPSTHPWGLVAACSCALSCAHAARPGLGVLPNPPEACLGPMRLTPPHPDPPAFDSFLRSTGGVLLLVGVDLGRHGRSRHAWMNVGMIEVRFCRVEPCSTASAWRSGEGVKSPFPMGTGSDGRTTGPTPWACSTSTGLRPPRTLAADAGPSISNGWRFGREPATSACHAASRPD